MLAAADVGTSVMPPHFDWLPGCLESADEADKSSDTFLAQSRQAAVIMMFTEPSAGQKHFEMQ